MDIERDYKGYFLHCLKSTVVLNYDHSASCIISKDLNQYTSPMGV